MGAAGGRRGPGPRPGRGRARQERGRQDHAAGGGRRAAPARARHGSRTGPPASAGCPSVSRPTSPSPSAPTWPAWPAPHGLAGRPRWSRSRCGATRLFLTRYLDTNLAEVSKGTAQKVGLVQALIPRPDLLVLDEPWEGLDGPTRDQIPAIVGEVLAVGGSVLVSDHLGEVATAAGCGALARRATGRPLPGRRRRPRPAGHRGRRRRRRGPDRGRPSCAASATTLCGSGPRGGEAEPTYTGFGAALAASPGSGRRPLSVRVPALGSRLRTPERAAVAGSGLHLGQQFRPEFPAAGRDRAGPAWPTERDRPEIPWHDVPVEDPPAG